MPRKMLVFLLFAACLAPVAAFAQTSAYGHWVNDPNNIATPAFVYDPPPVNFNPLTASELELEQWGFPPRPSIENSTAFARWKKIAIMKRVTPSLTFTNIYNGPARGVELGLPGRNATATSSNWSGPVIDGANGTFKVNNYQISADWSIPGVAQALGTCNSTWDYSSQWVGFDGWGSSDVLQAGTEADVDCTSTSYSFWYEWYPYAETKISLAAYPGHQIGLTVWYTTSSPYGHADFADDVDGQTASIGFNPPSGTVLVGNSAEWVVERTTVNGSLADLPNYGMMAILQPFAAVPGSTSYSPSSPPAGTTVYDVSMTCPPWNPSSSCTKTTIISGFYTSVYPGSILDTLVFNANPPAW